MFNILNRIEALMEERNWTRYRMSIESDVGQNIISEWYNNNKKPSLQSIEKLCNAFGITMAEFFNTDEVKLALTDDQKKLIENSVMLNSNQRKELIRFIDETIE